MQETITSGLRPKSSFNFNPSTPYLIQTGDDGTEALHSNESGSPRFFRLRSSPIGILTILEGCLEFASVAESEFERGIFFCAGLCDGSLYSCHMSWRCLR